MKQERVGNVIALPESTDEREREFNYTDADFERVSAMVYRSVGIRLTEAKRDLVYGRLARRIRHLRLNSFRDYLDYVEEHPKEEFTEFINSITTNLTSFFRERHHFDMLRAEVFPKLMRTRSASRRIRIWSAGCSTGEEPYSLAMTVASAFPAGSGWDVKILATDLDTHVLEHARAGIYTEERVSQLPSEVRQQWIRRGRGEHAGKVRIAPEIQQMVTFNQLNLMEAWPMRGPMDIIFCRNVVIYFDKQTQSRLFDRFADILADDGHLFVGHSETLYRVTERFELIGQTVYKKVGVGK